MAKKLSDEEKEKRKEIRQKQRKDKLFPIFKTQNLSYNSPIQKIIDIYKETKIVPTIVLGHLINFSKQDSPDATNDENEEKEIKKLEEEIAELKK